METVADTMSKGDFALHIGVTPGRISQYIAEGKISGDALEGQGRRARIRTAIAINQIKRTLDPNQRFGANGSALRNPASVAPATTALALPLAEAGDRSKAKAPLPIVNSQTDELAELRLRQERVKAEKLEREADLDVGRYMLAEDARRQMAKAVAAAYGVMEQGLQDIAATFAEQFGIPQRDAQHALAKAFRAVRTNAVAGFVAQADQAPEHVEDPGK